jgi:Cu+-exporting ATPase
VNGLLQILWGDVHVNESLLTGESRPITKKKDALIGGSCNVWYCKGTGNAAGKIPFHNIPTVKQAQGEKPPFSKWR